MRRLVPLLVAGLVIGAVPAQAQLEPTGDFRAADRLTTAPILGPSSIPGVSPDPMRFRDAIGPKSSQDILKSLDKDLGRSTLEPLRGRQREEHLIDKPGEDLGKRPAAATRREK
jgi:hypothetical protein